MNGNSLGLEEVAPADLHRVQAELVGGEVHHPLEVAPWPPAGPAPRNAPTGCGVGERRPRRRSRSAGCRRRPAPSCTSGRVPAPRRSRRRHRRRPTTRARSPVMTPVAAQARARSSRPAPRPCGIETRFSERVSTHVTGRPERAGHPDHDGVLGEQTGLAAEAAADVRGDHAHPVGVEPEDRRDLVAEAVRHLGGDPDRQRRSRRRGSRAARRSRCPPWAHGQPLVDHARPHDHLGAVERVGLGRGAHAGGEVATRAPGTAARRRARARPPGRRPRAAGRSRPPPARRRRRRRPSSRPITTATASPTKRTRSVASGGRGRSGLTTMNPWCAGRSRSAAVKTATTPGRPRRLGGVDRR